jgi:hypothetical protein
MHCSTYDEDSMGSGQDKTDAPAEMFTLGIVATDKIEMSLRQEPGTHWHGAIQSLNSKQ